MPEPILNYLEAGEYNWNLWQRYRSSPYGTECPIRPFLAGLNAGKHDVLCSIIKADKENADKVSDLIGFA